MGKQFANVNCRYGAPMGRHGSANFDELPRSISVFKVNLDSGGYDDGGAYWGSGLLYCLRQDDTNYLQFVRANSRLSAIAECGIPFALLKKPPISAHEKLKALESRGVISAAGIKLLQALGDLI